VALNRSPADERVFSLVNRCNSRTMNATEKRYCGSSLIKPTDMLRRAEGNFTYIYDHRKKTDLDVTFSACDSSLSPLYPLSVTTI
jgi:hypothetical protein